MMDRARLKRFSANLTVILFWGTVWGIFEATVGYLIHAVSFPYSFLVWYPASCFFMANVYRKTHSALSMLFVGLFSGSMKLLNLLLPGRIDKVINPAISIVFEAMAFALAVFVVNRYFAKIKGQWYWQAVIVLCVNTGWRMLYCLYLLLLVPDWMRDVSVISSSEKLIPFMVTQNALTSLLVFAGLLLKQYVFKPVRFMEEKLGTLSVSQKWRPVVTVFVLVCLVAANAVLELVL